MKARRTRKPVKRLLALEAIEVAGVSSPYEGRMDLLVTMHGRDRHGNSVPIEFRVFDKNVDQMLATLQEGISMYKMTQAQGDA